MRRARSDLPACEGDKRSPEPSPPTNKEIFRCVYNIPFQVNKSVLTNILEHHRGKSYAMLSPHGWEGIYIVIIPSRIRIRLFIETILTTYGPTFRSSSTAEGPIKVQENGSSTITLHSTKYNSNLIITELHFIQAHTILQMLTETQLWTA
jgi:hypothetical protein